MADHIPIVTSDDSANLAKVHYSDSEIIRVPLVRGSQICVHLDSVRKTWVDPCVDGLDDLKTRRGRPEKRNGWFDMMRSFPYFEKIGDPEYQATPVKSEVAEFVSAVLDACAQSQPSWITVPQLPLQDDSGRNKINRVMAGAAGRWRSNTKFHGRFVLPLILTNQKQLNRKTARNAKVQQAERCFEESSADGIWAVDMSLADDSGSSTLRNTRFPSVISLHEELNERISAKFRVGGPYWGLNLVLWARGLISHPAVGLGSGYKLFLSGGHASSPVAKLMLMSLRRRVKVGPAFRAWLDEVLAALSVSHPAYKELNEIRRHFTYLSQPERAREQVAIAYKKWFDSIANIPPAGRSMALYQDLSTAYAFAKSLPDLPETGVARRPEAVVEPLMLSCL